MFWLANIAFLPLYFSSQVSIRWANACYIVHGLADVELAFVYNVPFYPPSYLYFTMKHEYQVPGTSNETIFHDAHYHLILISRDCRTTASFVYAHPGRLTNVSIDIRLHKGFPVLASYLFMVKQRTDELVMLEDVNNWMGLLLYFNTSGSSAFEDIESQEDFSSRVSLSTYQQQFFRYAVYELEEGFNRGKKISPVISISYTAGEQSDKNRVQYREIKSGGYLVNCRSHTGHSIGEVNFVHSDSVKFFIFVMKLKDPFGEFEDRIFIAKPGRAVVLVSDRLANCPIRNLLLLPFSEIEDLSITHNNVLAVFTSQPHVRVCHREEFVDVVVEYTQFGNASATYGYSMRTKEFTKSVYLRTKIEANHEISCKTATSLHILSSEPGHGDKYVLPY